MSRQTEPEKHLIRIGVDARPLNFPYSGIGQYLHALLKILIPATTNQVRWHFYSDRKLPVDFPWCDSVLRCGTNSSRLLSTAFAQSYFGRWAGNDRLDVFWSPRHQLPLGLSSNISSVVTLHDLVFVSHPQTMTRAGRTLERLFTPRCLQTADAVVTTSLAVMRDVEKYDHRLVSKTQVIPLSSDIADLPPAQKEAQRDHPHPASPYLLFCGSTEPRKNLNRLLNAFARLKAEPSPPAQRLIIVSGGGWNDDLTMALIERYSAFVDLRRNVTEAQKAELLRHADFLVLPSLTEGFGIPLVEAQKLGVPILTSNTGAMPEVAGDAAVYVDPYDESSIERALKELCTGSELRERLSKNALTQADAFNWRTSAMKTLEVLTGVARQS